MVELANGRPFFAKSTFANIEIVAVIGIFSLYVLEFAGIHTFSQLLPQRETETPALSFFTGSGEQVIISTGTIAIMAVVALITIFYFAFLRKRIKVRK